MKLLAIDTSLSACSAAVAELGRTKENLFIQTEEIGRGHAEKIMGMVDGVMAESSKGFSDLDRIVVNVGPGSFTGLRVGLSIARGFGLVSGKPVVGVTTLECIASEILATRSCSGDLLVVLDARRDEVYCQQFKRDGSPADEARVSTLQELAKTLGSDTYLAGSAAEALGHEAGLPSERILGQNTVASIEYIARCGFKADPEERPPVPLYLRKPDAKPQQKGRIRRQ
ncbi:tRNA (adenosine(37)-N6)-threonylcarbamoyltransferase complex dimerization subunit type 1 TsaB [Flexibacterium corallicola]|uniref:tRNA (adenosine(37)-N6)-threonylcarbamoyltransferase complex dimerization subunit type 1 TsaB n=1 Tax=Flexibacterium corallicola TaxID=3037259 RepID=UPI00286EFE05|nr:tRNA (adenosine(37)-N6)-threonylcarbamoyltransferase complex dimerization subunit type 1 TsaB [Pseudovibrio sp. M1P-2-3]